MKHLILFIVAAAAVSSTVASSWFPTTKAVFNKWHETELERWLSDHNVPYPSPADRADLEALVEKNWNDFVLEPYQKWDTLQLKGFLRAKRSDVGANIEEMKVNLVDQVKSNWHETEDSARQAYANVKDWIFDTWTESQLKGFCDKNGIPVPQPRHRDSLLQKARSGYETAAKKVGETSAYPGNWLYQSWAESDLKSWLDIHGFPAPQSSTREKLVASVRRNSRIAYLMAQREALGASAGAHAAYSALTDVIIETWSESQLKEFCDQNGITVPHGTRIKELRALIRKKRAEILGHTAGASAASVFGAATSKVGNQFTSASETASLAAQDAFDQAVKTWSESRLKGYLDSRGVPVPQTSTLDDLRALVRKHSHKAASGWSIWTFDDFSRENLKQYLDTFGNDAVKLAAEKNDASRDALKSVAHSIYSSASAAGGNTFASVTSALASATAIAKKDAFDTWSDTDLKAYLDSFGVSIPQGSRYEEIKALARKHSVYFKYGTSTPSETVFAKFGETARDSWNWLVEQLHLGSQVAQQKAAEAHTATKDKAKQVREEL